MLLQLHRNELVRLLHELVEIVEDTAVGLVNEPRAARSGGAADEQCYTIAIVQ